MYKPLIFSLATIAAAAPFPGSPASLPFSGLGLPSPSNSPPRSPSPSPSASSTSQTPPFYHNNGVLYDPASFDDLIPIAGAVAVQEIGPYDGLDYIGIDLVSPGLAGVVAAGVVPNTSPNVGVYGEATSDVLEDGPFITTNYTGSVSLAFDFEEFYFGCEEGTLEAVASTLAACNVTVSAYRGSHFIANQTFYYTADLLTDGLTSAMVKAELDPRIFKGITKATFSSDIVDIDVATVTLIDSLKYVVYYQEGKGPQDPTWKSTGTVLDTSALTKPVTAVTSKVDFNGIANTLGLGELTSRSE